MRTAFCYDGRPKKEQILVMGGADGFGELEKLAAFSMQITSDAEVVIICGRNKQAYRSLKEKYPQLTVLGYIDDLSSHFKEAKFVLTKGGGLTITEALCAECIPLFAPPILSWEDQAAQYITSQGAGLCLPDFGATSKRMVSALFRSSEIQAILRERCRTLAKPHAAASIVDLFISRSVSELPSFPQEKVLQEMKDYYKTFKAMEQSSLAKGVAYQIQKWIQTYTLQKR